MREFEAWWRLTVQQAAGGGGDPGSWEGTDGDPGWQELRAKRERLRGR